MEAQKKFREWKPEEYVDLPVTPAEVLPEDDFRCNQCHAVFTEYLLPLLPPPRHASEA